MQTLQNILATSGPILALIGTYCFILSYSKAHEIEHTIRKGRIAEGTVIELQDNPADLHLNTKLRRKAPLVDFHSHIGWHQYQSITYRDPSPYQVGQKVQIYYYFYKSRREFALADDEPGTLPKTLLKWGIIFCIIGYPILFGKLGGFF
ncbi:MAG: hypothetical protein IPM42_13560 [Saprospiraceae bacterium]|nr:hypothetical protein [Saprospiraceae bacterium]